MLQKNGCVVVPGTDPLPVLSRPSACTIRHDKKLHNLEISGWVAKKSGTILEVIEIGNTYINASIAKVAQFCGLADRLAKSESSSMFKRIGKDER